MKNFITNPSFLTGGPDPVFKLSFLSIRVIYDHGWPFAGQHTEKQRLLQAVQAAALVQATLVHRGAGLTIHLDETAAAGIRVPVTGFHFPVDRRAKPAVVLLLRGRLAGSWPARVSRRRPWVRLRRTFRLFTAVAMSRLCDSLRRPFCRDAPGRTAPPTTGWRIPDISVPF